MCGRYNVTDSPEVKTLMEQLGLPGVIPRPQHNVPLMLRPEEFDLWLDPEFH